jgi:hypothetical protein
LPFEEGFFRHFRVCLCHFGRFLGLLVCHSLGFSFAISGGIYGFFFAISGGIYMVFFFAVSGVIYGFCSAVSGGIRVFLCHLEGFSSLGIRVFLRSVLGFFVFFVLNEIILSVSYSKKMSNGLQPVRPLASIWGMGKITYFLQ